MTTYMEQQIMSEQRQQILREALANQRLEGGDVSQETQDAAQLWAKGKITADELVQMVKDKHVRRRE